MMIYGYLSLSLSLSRSIYCIYIYVYYDLLREMDVEGLTCQKRVSVAEPALIIYARAAACLKAKPFIQ